MKLTSQHPSWMMASPPLHPRPVKSSRTLLLVAKFVGVCLALVAIAGWQVAAGKSLSSSE